MRAIKDEKSKDRSSLNSIIIRISLSGVFTALIFVATMFIKLPTGYGYYNLGDGVILVCAYLMGPIAFFPAAVGSALADLASGYAIYIPATFLIKGIMGLFVGIWFIMFKVTIVHRLLAFLGAEIIMIGGYFLYESLPMMYGPIIASGHIIFNALQAAVGIAVAIILSSLLSRLRPRVQDKLALKN